MVLFLLMFCVVLPASVFADGGGKTESANTKGLEPILGYISKSWDTLTRSLEECTTVVDPKLAENSVLYLPADMAIPTSRRFAEALPHQVKMLPEKITRPGQLDTSKLDPPRLLYLEHKYVVPGWRFNERYGLDSYFIVRGLVRDGRVDLAKGMIENFFFEIEHYGTVLNANRSYYLSRSQPPFLTSMILAVYEAEKAAGHEDKKWLERAYGYAAKDWEMWAREPHLAGDTGLARYYDFGDVPAPESLKDETDHYRKVASYFLNHPEQDHGYLVRATPLDKNGNGETTGRRYSVQICDLPTPTEKAGCDETEQITLSRDFYRGDRSMRESGFDVSFRFGPHGAATQHYAAVCLNSLLFKYEKDLEAISTLLGNARVPKSGKTFAAARRKYSEILWDAKQRILFRLQPGPQGTLDLPLHHHVLSDVGGRSDQRASCGDDEECGQARAGRRTGDESL
jgi:alpha,alpha-trehalase